MAHELRADIRGVGVWGWQTFLLGQSLYKGTVDGVFGPKTVAATRKFQRMRGLQVDGIVGNQTFCSAMGMGYELVQPETSRAAPA